MASTDNADNRPILHGDDNTSHHDETDHEPFLVNQNNSGEEQLEGNNNNNNAPREGGFGTFMRHIGSFCYNFNLDDPHQRIRARFILTSGIVLALIAVHVILVFILMLTYKKPQASEEPGSGEQEGETDPNKNTRNIFTYVVMIPNIFFLLCMSCCVCGLCVRRLLQYFITQSTSPSAEALRNHLERMGLSVLIAQPTMDNITRQQHIMELHEGLRNSGIDMYRLQLAMIDRDFNASDYEALLELDNLNHLNRGASESEIARLPIFKIPVIRDEDTTKESSNDQSSSGTLPSTSDATIVDLPNSPSDVPYCSEKLAKSLIGQVTCPICLENYAVGDCVSSLPCLHRFHRDCINQALRIKSSCPVCQTTVF